MIFAAEGFDIAWVAIDVTCSSSVRTGVKQVDNNHGGLDILVNNAGILTEATAPDGTGPLAPDIFRQTFETNVFGAVTVVEGFLASLRQSTAGRIVTVSSTMGIGCWAGCGSDVRARQVRRTMSHKSSQGMNRGMNTASRVRW
jgi:NAD(P)-dependent dehydrogenase (short-subunit alcohol dehydrogenase family)